MGKARWSEEQFSQFENNRIAKRLTKTVGEMKAREIRAIEQQVNRIEIKPLSVNQAWQGKRFKTKKYEQYEKDLGSLLPKITLPQAPYEIYFKFGMSSTLSDYDNPIKPTQDILQKKYGFDDKLIVRAIVEKVKTKKGSEFIEFEIKTFPTP